MLQECKRFLDTNIYRSFNILKTDYATYFKHFDKGFKESIGVKIDINSYLGMMIHCNSYNLRKKILNDIKLMPFGKYLYVNEKLTKVMIYQDYIEIHKRKHKYYNQVKHKSDAT